MVTATSAISDSPEFSHSADSPPLDNQLRMPLSIGHVSSQDPDLQRLQELEQVP